MDSPTVMFTTPAVFSIIERLVTPTVNVNYNQALPRLAPTGVGQGIQLNYGVNNLFYRGVPIFADEKCTANNIWTLNENHMFLYQISHDPLFVDAAREGFGWTGWKKSANQDAIVGQLLWAGQLVGDSPRTMARRTAVTS